MSSVYGSANEIAAQIVGGSPEMDLAMAAIADLARANAARHTRNSWDKDDADEHFAGSIVVTVAGNGKDRLVSNTDPLAIPKEYGHLLVRGKGSDQEVVGYVRGQYSMRNAALEYPGLA